MNWTVPLFDTDLGETEIEAVSRVLRSGWLTMGEETAAFEREFSDFLGVRHAFMVANCTAALHLAHHVLGAHSGDEVICPSLTFVATANSIAQAGARPVFADVASLDDLTVSPLDIERRITANTRGITVMHYAGYACAIERIAALARSRSLYLVEDCAHSPGSSLDGQMLGTFGEVGCFSFFSNKNLSTGEGGMIVTNRDDLAERIGLLRSHGMTTLTLDRHKGHAFSYDVVAHGFNYRSAEINAAIGRVQLGKLAEKNRRRRELSARYRTRLKDLKGLALPFSARPTAEVSSAHIYPIMLPPFADRAAIMAALRDRGVQTSIHYPPVHSFTAYRASDVALLPLTEQAGARLLTLPLFPTMTDGQHEHVVDSLRLVLARANPA